MVYNPSLARRVRELLRSKGEFQERKMFGGVAYMYKGNMALGVLQDDLIVRIGLEKYQAALRQPGVELFGPTGKPMAGWIAVTPQGYQEGGDLVKWIDQALEFVKTLPEK